MREIELGPLTVRLTGGSDREGGGDGPVVVLLHGFGAPGTDLVGLWRQLSAPEGTRFAFPEGPLALDIESPFQLGDARAWWPLDVQALEKALVTGNLDALSEREPDGMAAARAKVIEMLDALEVELGVSGDRVVLGGFSQGAMLSLDVALRTERPLAGLVQMSGTLLCKTEWSALMPKRRGLPVLQSHGRQDPLLPFSLAEELRDLMTAAGLDVHFVPFNGEHGISDGVLEELNALVMRALSRP